MQSGHQTLALDIMEQMTLHQVPTYFAYLDISYKRCFKFIIFLKEGALERLYRWTQSYCRYIDNPDMTELLTCAMERLQDRPVLFK